MILLGRLELRPLDVVCTSCLYRNNDDVKIVLAGHRNSGLNHFWHSVVRRDHLNSRLLMLDAQFGVGLVQSCLVLEGHRGLRNGSHLRDHGAFEKSSDYLGRSIFVFEGCVGSGEADSSSVPDVLECLLELRLSGLHSLLERFSLLLVKIASSLHFCLVLLLVSFSGCFGGFPSDLSCLFSFLQIFFPLNIGCFIGFLCIYFLLGDGGKSLFSHFLCPTSLLLQEFSGVLELCFCLVRIFFCLSIPLFFLLPFNDQLPLGVQQPLLLESRFFGLLSNRAG